jgi:hypothetical protein
MQITPIVIDVALVAIHLVVVNIAIVMPDVAQSKKFRVRHNSVREVCEELETEG